MSIDVLLSSIEKYTYFENKCDNFPKFRLFNIVGFAAGFSFNTDNLIKANIDHPLIGYAKYYDLDTNMKKSFGFKAATKVAKPKWVFLNKSTWKIENLQ